MNLPPWVSKNWPFVAAALVFVFLAFQLSQARGCGSPESAPDEQHWPKQRPPPQRK